MENGFIVNDVLSGLMAFIGIVFLFGVAAFIQNRIKMPYETRMILRMNKLGRKPSTIAHHVNIVRGTKISEADVIKILHDKGVLGT